MNAEFVHTPTQHKNYSKINSVDFYLSALKDNKDVKPMVMPKYNGKCLNCIVHDVKFSNETKIFKDTLYYNLNRMKVFGIISIVVCGLFYYINISHA